MSDVFSSAFERLLHAKITKEVGDETHNVATGAAQDFANYSKRVGKIEGLYIALALFEDTRRELHGEDPKDRKKP